MLEISLIDVLLLASGVLAVLVIGLSRTLRRLPVSEPLVALIAGVLLGPQVLGALEVAPFDAGVGAPASGVAATPHPDRAGPCRVRRLRRTGHVGTGRPGGRTHRAVDARR